MVFVLGPVDDLLQPVPQSFALLDRGAAPQQQNYEIAPLCLRAASVACKQRFGLFLRHGLLDVGDRGKDFRKLGLHQGLDLVRATLAVKFE
jgi:hypothetical protein